MVEVDASKKVAKQPQSRKGATKSVHEKTPAVDQGLEDSAGGEENTEKDKGSRILINWSLVNMHPYTDKLLLLLEESPTWKMALGFDKGADQQVKNGGKKLVEHYLAIARRLFIEDLSQQWDEDDLIKLGDAVKNRIDWIKKSFIKSRSELSEAGQDLVEADPESKIQAGSALESIWDMIKTKFPWYNRVHRLMGTSPVVNHSAIAHSYLELNISVLGQPDSDPIVLDHNGITDDHSPTAEGYCVSPDLDIDDARKLGSDIDEGVERSGHLPMDFPGGNLYLSPSLIPAPRVVPRKRKQHEVDKLDQIAAADRATHVFLAQKRIQGRMERARLRHKTALEIERMRLTAEKERLVCKQEHEFRMLDRKLGCEKLINERQQQQQWGTLDLPLILTASSDIHTSNACFPLEADQREPLFNFPSSSSLGDGAK